MHLLSLNRHMNLLFSQTEFVDWRAQSLLDGSSGLLKHLTITVVWASSSEGFFLLNENRLYVNATWLYRRLKKAVVMWIGEDPKQPDLVVIPLNFFHKPSFQGKNLCVVWSWPNCCRKHWHTIAFNQGVRMRIWRPKYRNGGKKELMFAWLYSEAGYVLEWST